MPNLIQKLKTKLSRKNLQKQLIATKELLDIYVKNNEHLRREGIIARARNTSLELKIQNLFQEKTDLLKEIMDLKNEIRRVDLLLREERMSMAVSNNRCPIFTSPEPPADEIDANESTYEQPSFNLENNNNNNNNNFINKNSSSGYNSQNSEILCDFGQKYGLETGTIIVRENNSGSGAHLETNIRSTSVTKVAKTANVYDNVPDQSTDEIFKNINKYSKELEQMQERYKTLNKNFTFLTNHQVSIDMSGSCDDSVDEIDEIDENNISSSPSPNNKTRNLIKTSSKNSSKVDFEDESLDSNELSKINSDADLLQMSIIEEIKSKMSKNSHWTILSRREGSDFMFNKVDGACKVRFSYAL